jgi:hypothetical protein
MNDLLQQGVQEQVTGMLLGQRGGAATLVIGEQSFSSNGNLLANGLLTLRYAIPYLGKSHLSIIPAHLIAERGGELNGWQAWDFIYQRFELHPRAEVFGVRSDGTTDQCFLRILDIGEPIRIYAYEHAHSAHPLAQVTKVIAAETDRAGIPERLSLYLPAEES